MLGFTPCPKQFLQRGKFPPPVLDPDPVCVPLPRVMLLDDALLVIDKLPLLPSMLPSVLVAAMKLKTFSDNFR